MKITNLISSGSQAELLQVQKAIYISEYIINISFSDGVEKQVDFGPFLTQNNHPGVEKYLEMSLFKNFKLVHGNIHWGDFEMLFPVEDLYAGKLLPSQKVA